MDFGDSYSDNFSLGRKMEALESESSTESGMEAYSDRSVRSRACEEETTKKRRKVKVSFAMVMAAIAPGL